jgi:hypothetical protein
MTIRCNAHPGGPVDLEPSAFYPSDQRRKIAICIKCRLRRAKELRDRKKQASVAPTAATSNDIMTVTPQVEQVQSVIETMYSNQPTQTMQKIGGYYISENTLLLVDTTQTDRVVIHTTLLEIDRETKHPRNKRLLFTLANDPKEYHGILAWVDRLAGTPIDVTSTVNEHAALQLAAETEQKLVAANKRIEELEAALKPLRALLNNTQ